MERSVEAAEAGLGLKLQRFSPEETEGWKEYLARLWDPDNLTLKRPLRRDEQEFILNERLLTALDFRYWLKYCFILRDPEIGGGLGALEPLKTQEMAIDLIAKMELEQTDAKLRGEPVEGTLIAAHKSRQLGITMLTRALIMHRITTNHSCRAITASINEDKVVPIYDRDKRILDNLPWYLQPVITAEEKARHIKFGELDSFLLYQELVQRAGIAQGEQWDVGHMTEVASVPGLDFEIQHQYEPTIPRSVNALHVLETTPQGRNNWWRFFVDNVRKGYSRWKLLAIPWYVEPRKYRLHPPEGWEPSGISYLHAQKVHDTSPEYLGYHVMLTKEQLYWHERTREDYQRNNNLAAFYSNYWAVIEESFQHVEQSVWTPEILEQLRAGAEVPQAYEVLG